mgnify:CR=1 FL=1
MTGRAGVPWPWPLAAGMVVGVATGGAVGGTVGGALAWPLLVGAGVGLTAAIAVRGPVARAAWGALALGLVLGALRGHAFATAPDAWAGRAGEAIEVVARVADGVAWPVGPPGPGLLLRGAAPPGGVHLLQGSLVELPGRRNPGGFDARAHHGRHGITAALRVERSEPRAPPGFWPRARARLRLGVVAGLGAREAALMQALTLGWRDDLGPLRDAFAASGLAHVLALSGLHVGVLAGALTALAGGVGRARSLAVVAVLLAYLAVVGPSPAVVRATAMVSAALLGRAYGVGGAGWATHLALAGAATLAVRPGWLGSQEFIATWADIISFKILFQFH